MSELPHPWPATPSPMTPELILRPEELVSLDTIRRIAAPFIEQMLHSIHKAVIAEVEIQLRTNPCRLSPPVWTMNETETVPPF